MEKRLGGSLGIFQMEGEMLFSWNPWRLLPLTLGLYTSRVLSWPAIKTLHPL